VFGIGGSEFVIIALVALFIFGPERLPGAVKSAAKILHDVRRWTTKARSDLTDTLGPEFENFDLADLNPKRFVQKHLLEGLDDVDEEEVERRRAARLAAAESAGTPALEPAGATALGSTVEGGHNGAVAASAPDEPGGGAVRVDTLALTESAAGVPGRAAEVPYPSDGAVPGADHASRRSTAHVDFDAT